MHRALVSEVDVLANSQTLRVLIRQDGRAGGLGLADGIDSSGIVQEDVVNATRVPGVYAASASETRVADKGVATAIVISSIVMRSVVVLLQEC